MSSKKTIRENIDNLNVRFERRYPKKDFYKSFESELKEIFQKAEVEKIQTLVIGYQSVGKSTFINAMLGDKILPTSNKKQTGKLYYIYNRDLKTLSLEISQKEKNDTPIIFEGSKEILSEIRKIDEKNPFSAESNFELSGQFNAFREVDLGRRLVFVESPGFISPNQVKNQETQNSKIPLASSEIHPGEIKYIILIMSSQKLDDPNEIELLQKYFENNFFTNLNKIFILINIFPGKNPNPNSKNMEIVFNKFSKYTKKENIFGIVGPEFFNGR